MLGFRAPDVWAWFSGLGTHFIELPQIVRDKIYKFVVFEMPCRYSGYWVDGAGQGQAPRWSKYHGLSLDDYDSGGSRLTIAHQQSY